MQGRTNAIKVTVEPPMRESIGPKCGTASATPRMTIKIAVRIKHLLQPKPEIKS